MPKAVCEKFTHKRLVAAVLHLNTTANRLFFKLISRLAVQLLYTQIKSCRGRMLTMTLNNSLSTARVDEVAKSVFQSDTLASHEYFETCRRKSHLEPEKDLMFAALEDAVRCYRAYAFAKSSASRRLYRDAEKWLWKNDWDWCFSFRNICEVLGLDPFCLRRGLLRWKEAHNGSESFGKPRVCLPRRRAA